MCHRYKALSQSLITAALGLALCLAIPASAKPPSWDKKIEGKGRFKVLKAFDGEAVLDKETGLVWAQSPFSQQLDWAGAATLCLRSEIGGRAGWRLPRYEELASVLNPRSQELPADHPFDVPDALYWSATTTITNSGSSTSAAVIRLGPGPINFNAPKTGDTLQAWCVRGGTGIDDQ